MKYKGYVYLCAFVALILVVGLACSGGESTSQPAAQSTDTAQPANTGGGYTTFTDQNKYYQIDVPSGWKHDHTVDNQNNYYYIDTFTSPDSKAVIENIAYDNGTPFTGSQNGQFALQLLNQNYSYTKQEGDIHVTNDSIQKDGSERLTWFSKGGGYSGISYFEIRNKTTFLIFTVDWVDDAKDTYFDTLDHVVSSYTTP